MFSSYTQREWHALKIQIGSDLLPLASTPSLPLQRHPASHKTPLLGSTDVEMNCIFAANAYWNCVGWSAGSSWGLATFQNVHLTPRSAFGFQNPVRAWLYHKIMQTANRSRAKSADECHNDVQGEVRHRKCWLCGGGSVTVETGSAVKGVDCRRSWVLLIVLKCYDTPWILIYTIESFKYWRMYNRQRPLLETAEIPHSVVTEDVSKVKVKETFFLVSLCL